MADLSPEELKQLEQQLRCPTGEMGIRVGRIMNDTNAIMTLSALEALAVAPQEIVLEIGHGSGAHIPLILENSYGVKYCGLEISKIMHEQANLCCAGIEHVELNFYNGIDIPYPNAYFNKIFTVNTIYFWTNPSAFILEIKRVLHPKGIIVISFALRDFMQNLPFVGDVFELYNESDVKDLASKNGLKILSLETQNDRVKSKSDKFVQRQFCTVILTIDN